MHIAFILLNAVSQEGKMEAAGSGSATQHATLAEVERSKTETFEKKPSEATALHRSVKADDPDIDMLSASMERADVNFTSASEMSRNLADRPVEVTSGAKRKRALSHVSSDNDDPVGTDNQHGPSAKVVRRISSDEIDLESIEKNGKTLLADRSVHETVVNVVKPEAKKTTPKPK